MNNKLYDILKSIALIWLPALGTLVFALSDIWKITAGPQIYGSIMAVDLFLGAGLGISSMNFNARATTTKSAQLGGELLIDREGNPIRFQLVGGSAVDPDAGSLITVKVTPTGANPSPPAS